MYNVVSVSGIQQTYAANLYSKVTQLYMYSQH